MGADEFKKIHDLRDAALKVIKEEGEISAFRLREILSKDHPRARDQMDFICALALLTFAEIVLERFEEGIGVIFTAIKTVA